MSMALVAQLEPIGANLAVGIGGGVMAALMMLAYVGVFVYLLLLVTRFVRAVEKIADKLDRTQQM